MIHSSNNKNKIEYIKGNYGKIISLKRNTNNNTNNNNKYNTDNNHNIDENHKIDDHPPREKRIVKINKEKKKAPPDIDEQFEKIYQEIKPFEDDNEKKQKIHFKIQNIVDSVYKDAVLHFFGSSVNQFNLRNSDLDMVLILPKEYNSIPHSEIVQTLADKFTELNYESVICYPQARVPIVKFVDNETKIDVDICIDNKLAIASSHLLATYSKIDERVIKLSHMVKYWAKKRNINSPFRGTLGSYGYVLMVISFLQQTTPPILPVLQQSEKKDTTNSEETLIDGNDCSYDKSYENFQVLNKETVGNLLFQFFEYFFRFDYYTNAISVRLGKNIRKIDHKWNKNQFKRDFFFLVIEDPFNTGSSVGSNIYMQGFQKIVHELQRAMELLHQNKGLDSVVSSEFNEF